MIDRKIGDVLPFIPMDEQAKKRAAEDLEQRIAQAEQELEAVIEPEGVDLDQVYIDEQGNYAVSEKDDDDDT